MRHLHHIKLTLKSYHTCATYNSPFSPNPSSQYVHWTSCTVSHHSNTTSTTINSCLHLSKSGLYKTDDKHSDATRLVFMYECDDGHLLQLILFCFLAFWMTAELIKTKFNRLKTECHCFVISGNKFCYYS
jgi:hypothetical protein